ncbi:predicted protein [Micromonas commoda]|uniref:HTH cro/C1-type domain-containing protein n=1 Tax=Micromonas commoda (strain RCC299 / NOUM17 / CCMP2709) TaxID=296587 RepID=C1E3G5_MICCC|nr:predicted protein [Micromonas commoda]ACO62932.1 predicted protein [Micromonas commoda]|eukprot:XP_002501674.1 predicted protein [Micromonas commoda]
MTHDDEVDATSGTPALAVERLLALEREGLKFHQMRERCRDILAAPDVHVPSFAADAIAILANHPGRKTAAVDPIAHLIMECVPRVTAHIRERHDFPMMDDVSVRERFADAKDRSPGVRLILDALAAAAAVDDESAESAGGSIHRRVTGTTRLDPRTLLRVAETYGVSLEDLIDAGGGDARTSLEAYARSLMYREGKHAPGVNLALWFSLDAFASVETVDELTRCGAFGLASDVAACVAGSELKRRCVEACLELGDSGDHAGLRAAHAAAERFQLGTVFPTVKRRYFESTIKRMVAKGQAEAALRHAGDDKDLIRCVIASLVASGDASTAAEYVARLGSDLSPGEDFDVGDLLGTETELAAAQAARRDAHVQLPEGMAENGGVVWVDDEDGLRAACDALLAADVVGLDTEWAADPDAERMKAERNRRRKGTRWARKRWRDQKKLAKKLAAEAEALEASNGESDADDASSRDASSGEGEGEGERTGAGAGGEDEDAAERRAASVVALLQVATRDRVFLVDLPALLRACPDAIAPTLGAVLADRSVLKTGFGLAEDLRRLARLHPPAFGAERLGGPSGGVGPVIDLQHVWAAGTRIAREEAADGGRAKRGRRARAAAAAAAAAEGGEGGGGGGVAASPPKRLVGPWSLKEHYQRKHLVGLSHLTAAVLGKPLDKATRMSDWSKRPLTPRQVTYAALDAWVLVELMRTLRENHAEELERLAGGLTHVRE